MGFMLVLAAGRKSSSEKVVGLRNSVVECVDRGGDVTLLAVAGMA